MGKSLFRFPTAMPEFPLSLQTRFVGHDFRHVERTGSTNADLLRAVAEGAPEGTVILAEQQTEGHGRQGRSWISPAGAGLTFSVLFRPKGVAPADAATFPLVVGCAVARAVQAFLPAGRAMLKWPNDLQIAGRKLCGILCQMQTTADGPAIVAGIGLNVNLDTADLPPETAAIATSMRAAAGTPFNRAEVLSLVLLALEEDYGRWLAHGLAAFADDFAARDALRGREIAVEEGRTTLRGVADGINPDGSLRLRLADGSVESVYSGDAHVRL